MLLSSIGLELIVLLFVNTPMGTALSHKKRIYIEAVSIVVERSKKNKTGKISSEIGITFAKYRGIYTEIILVEHPSKRCQVCNQQHSIQLYEHGYNIGFQFVL